MDVERRKFLGITFGWTINLTPEEVASISTDLVFAGLFADRLVIGPDGSGTFNIGPLDGVDINDIEEMFAENLIGSHEITGKTGQGRHILKKL